jgi:hypothetical protein
MAPRSADAAGSVPPLRYRTFEVRPVAVEVSSVTAPVSPDVLGARVGAALEDRLEGRGLRRSSDNPDVVVEYAVAGRTTSPVERLTGLQPIEGTLSVKLYDPEAQRVVWQSSAQAGERELDDLVRVLLDRALFTAPTPS